MSARKRTGGNIVNVITTAALNVAGSFITVPQSETSMGKEMNKKLTKM